MKPRPHPPKAPYKPYAPILSDVFQELAMGAALFDLKQWYSINSVVDVLQFEQQHGVEHDRHKYNARCMSEARETLRPVLGTHSGFYDWFVPIVVRGRLRAVLATGPFARARPTSAQILEHWRSLTGRQGHPVDPEFAYYLSISLGTLVLDDAGLEAFRGLLECLAGIMSFDGRDEDWIAEAAKFRRKLAQARSVERTWDATGSMIDERTSRIWSSRHRADAAARLGLPAPADQALVGLIAIKRSDGDPIETLLQGDSFQRACVELAGQTGDSIAGRVGDYGVVFLSATSGSAQRKRARLHELGEKAEQLAKRFGFELHLGTSGLPGEALLSQHYQAALRGAEMALSQGVRLKSHAPESEHSYSALGEFRAELVTLASQAPKSLPARFERYLETVAQHCGYRLEPLRIHLEVGFERVLEGLLAATPLDRKTVASLRNSLERSAKTARTVAELSSAYRRAISDISDALLHPGTAHHDRNLRRAVAYIHEHYTEAISLPTVARIGGFAPNYFSLLFKQREKMTFARYVQRLRIERAHQLLSTTDIGLQRVAQLSGFVTANYMARVFRSVVGAAPGATRKKLR